MSGSQDSGPFSFSSSNYPRARNEPSFTRSSSPAFPDMFYLFSGDDTNVKISEYERAATSLPLCCCSSADFGFPSCSFWAFNGQTGQWANYSQGVMGPSSVSASDGIGAAGNYPKPRSAGAMFQDQFGHVVLFSGDPAGATQGTTQPS